MAVVRVTKVFAIKDAKVSALLSDPEGGTPTYGTPIDVPGIKSIEISGDIERKELRGDNKLLDVMAYLTNVTAAWNHAKISLDILVASIGGAVTDGGTGVDEYTEWMLKGDTATLPPFKLEGVTPGTDILGGDVHMSLYRLVSTSFPGLGFAEDDYKTPENEASAVPLLSTDEWIGIRINKTAKPIVTPPETP